MPATKTPRVGRVKPRRSLFGTAPRHGSRTPALDDLPESEIHLRQAYALVGELRAAVEQRAVATQ